MTSARNLLAAIAVALAAVAASAAAAEPKTPTWATKDLKAGLVGCDTSHAVAFTNVLNRHPAWRVKVVAAFPEASKDMPGPSVGRLP